ncbi:PncC family amidohydrolase [Anseongella ginsenosidimutans]|uniref:PncC family amidohydrolase n=2 Tax=Anseongella ginsenosidimutans TaxID=496056 RepID=A0A4R3KPL8_9SPHI|nr:PncC family amidohydrolase [Anseongella ginsenosidimutans]
MIAMLYNISFLNKIKDFLIENCQTVSVAESVTSGYLQAAFSSAVDATRFFQGGITAYNNGQKTRHLMVEPIHAEECNCISEKVSAEMAIGSNRLFSSDYAIGITGYANKPPGSGISTLFAFLAIAKGHDVIFAKKLVSLKTSMVEVQLDYTNQALELLSSHLQPGTQSPDTKSA